MAKSSSKATKLVASTKSIQMVNSLSQSTVTWKQTGVGEQSSRDDRMAQSTSTGVGTTIRMVLVTSVGNSGWETIRSID